MKLPCYLVQDLLPLYKDHVCDEQTSADVAEHLSGCAACSALLAEMDTPPQETAVQEEQAAEAAEALSTVKKNLRGRHIGEKLVSDCLVSAKKAGFRILQFNAVVATNASALHLYKKLGFVSMTAIPGGFLKKDGSYEDIIPHYHLL